MQGGAHVHSSTVVRRTEAGSAELAVPAHGLSLTQRRFLTLLDTSCSIDELARGHVAAARLERDLARLTELGFVACTAPLRIDPVPANEANASPATVRLGPPGLTHRLPFVLVPAAGAVLAWLALQYAAAPPAATGTRHTIDAAQRAVEAPHDRQVSEPQPIATRVLKGEPVDRRSRDGAKEPRPAPKGTQAPTDSTAVRSPLSLPVEHRSPPPDDAVNAPTGVPMPSTPPVPIKRD